MTNDLISRSALLKAMEEERKYLHKRGLGGAEHILIHHCLPHIDNAPTVYPICEDKACKYRANERPQCEWVEDIIEELESRMDYGQEYAQAMEDVIVILKAKFGMDMEAENDNRNT